MEGKEKMEGRRGNETGRRGVEDWEDKDVGLRVRN